MVHDGDHVGMDPKETAERLMEESAKAQANGRAYADLTVRNAAVSRGAPPPPAAEAALHGLTAHRLGGLNRLGLRDAKASLRAPTRRLALVEPPYFASV